MGVAVHSLAVQIGGVERVHDLQQRDPGQLAEERQGYRTTTFSNRHLDRDDARLQRRTPVTSEAAVLRSPIFSPPAASTPFPPPAAPQFRFRALLEYT
jgi:hypothetical protein